MDVLYQPCVGLVYELKKNSNEFHFLLFSHSLDRTQSHAIIIVKISKCELFYRLQFIIALFCIVTFSDKAVE